MKNRRYLGIYTYKDTEVPGGIPRIIDDDTFNHAQEIMAKNKKAPARAKAVKDNYLLTTRFFCATMVGTYQMLCGVAPDKWQTTITVEDDATHEVISKTTFPNATMFNAGAY